MPTIVKQKKTENTSIKGAERQAIYNTKKWNKLRLVKLMQNPLCEKCLQKGIISPAVDVHHIDSFMNYEGEKWKEEAFNFNNLESLCKECHQREHNS